MSAEKTEIETFFGKCRCCLAYGYLKNMWVEHEFEGETEIYGEMLVQCFCLSWDQSDEAMEQDQICEQCIRRLRDASDFKKVVLDSQEELVHQVDEGYDVPIKDEVEEEQLGMVHNQDNEVDKAETTYADTTYADTECTVETLDDESFKDETEYEDIEFLEEDDDGENAGATVVDSDSSQLTENQSRPAKRKKQPIKHDTKDGPKPKWPKRLPKSERFKTYRQYSEEELRLCMKAVRNNELTSHEASLKYNVPQKTISAKIRLDPKDVRSDQNSTNNATIMRLTRSRNKVPHRLTKEPKQKQNQSIAIEDETFGKKTEGQNKSLMMKHKNNLKMILKYSNATIVKSNSAAGYSCWFCDEHFSPANLKKHIMKHKNEFDDAIKVKYVSDLIMKVDITGLKCQVCKGNMDSLEDFMEHLQEEHKKTVYTDIESYIIPFKFDTEELQCVVCSQKFKHFKLLSEHMCEHYRNYECSVCRHPFINKKALVIHSYRHVRGEFECSKCLKVFDNRIKFNEHERVTHKLLNKKRKCRFCSEKFSSAELVKTHETKKHGIIYPKFNCDACNKSYLSQKGLTGHQRSHHLINVRINK